MDVSIKGLDPEVVARLSRQAEVEGVSAQEWMRQALRRTAALLTPRELSERAARRDPVPEDTYHDTMAQATARRSVRAKKMARSEGLDVRKRGR